MSQLTIQLSDRADALVAQLQKQIFNRRRKKVSPVAVIETLVESGARSQSDKRFATSWSNLVADIEQAAKVADAHGAKPANLSDEEWVMVLSHRTRQATSAPAKAPARKAKAAAKPAAKVSAASSGSSGRATLTPVPRTATRAGSADVSSRAKAAPTATAAAKAKAVTTKAKAVAKPAPSAAAASPAPVSKAPAAAPRRRSKAAGAPAAGSTRPAPRTSVARRMAKAVSRLGSQAVASPVVGAAAVAAEAPSANGVITTA